MKLSDEEVRKLADLARLYLTDEEVERFGGQLTDILTYVGVLSELDTEGVPETCQVTGLSNVTMKDEIVELTDPDELLEVSPLDKKDHQIRIKRLM
ncbi:Asp-tRNA(Asn)/Glu-tRNA(Gln) amidotransferase subunit GatC [Candidatus Peregrinibacteria bacterium]|jgi:aspartyl-tRNA(Asn)/glutamyl-tRNA(Gln) amidotransferase subunit C|nr:Asp-tRNA(Asn)/Glu-tRNA(Gln) amidotransferase subunit GatC [Candidatus Peregrinibacteria bacterium]MBT4632188.1 Asp-tRNA(Asn)/Glu-tRNA(Gln) amidotransferase subunit GatC [Candidatus Peregrinibacteria bacterium]MBT5516538.1 Asp-tRNA(Asn)/Glu-tRNA(Gln) amidotransferase subunit GatC [Candidatus Peregrinibacteria bacterium]MBT5824145.1 Asp-tRNA(Asn)/Glu-tRNA(Gln) amidotransferase subunit GatC [Candidatus Peregrinibacteria bacterium]